MTYSGAFPSVVGHDAATRVLTGDVDRLPSGCAPKTERSDPHLVSIVWQCGKRVASATVTLAGRPLALGTLMKGDYTAYLSSVAEQQFQVEGVAHPDTTDQRTWYLTPAALAVAYPAGIVSYPLDSLTPYLRDPAAL